MNKKYIIAIIIIIVAAIAAFFLYRKESSKFNHVRSWAKMQLFDEHGKTLPNTKVSINTKGMSEDIYSDTSGSIAIPSRYIGNSMDISAHKYRFNLASPLIIISAKGVIIENGKKVHLRVKVM